VPPSTTVTLDDIEDGKADVALGIGNAADALLAAFGDSAVSKEAKLSGKASPSGAKNSPAAISSFATSDSPRDLLPAVASLRPPNNNTFAKTTPADFSDVKSVCSIGA
jgi:hypothetical protein